MQPAQGKPSSARATHLPPALCVAMLHQGDSGFDPDDHDQLEAWEGVEHSVEPLHDGDHNPVEILHNQGGDGLDPAATVNSILRKNTVRVSARFLLRVAAFVGLSTLILIRHFSINWELVDKHGMNFDPPKYCISEQKPLTNITQYAACFPAAYYFRSGMMFTALSSCGAGIAMRHKFPFRVWVLLVISSFGLGGTCSVAPLEYKPFHTNMKFVFCIGIILFESGVTHCAFVFEREKLASAADTVYEAVTDQHSEDPLMTLGRQAQATAKQALFCGFKAHAFKHGMPLGGTQPWVLCFYSFLFSGLGWAVTFLDPSGVDGKDVYVIMAYAEWSLMVSMAVFLLHLSFIID